MYNVIRGNMEEQYTDVKATDEGLWDLYLNYCFNNHETPSIKDYTVWVEENYG